MLPRGSARDWIGGGGREDNILGRKSLLRDRTTEESGNVARGSVHLILATGNVEVLDEILEDGHGLCGLLARCSGNSGHFEDFFSKQDNKFTKKNKKKARTSKSVLRGYLKKRWRPTKETASQKTTQRPDRNLIFFLSIQKTKRKKKKKETEDQTSFSRRKKKKGKKGRMKR